MNFAAFDLNLLRVFDALMRERSATRAGEQIGMSQPAVSAALQRLRDIVDDKLFVRQGNDMVPTPRAETMAPAVREALASLEQLIIGRRKFDPAAQNRTFTLMGADFSSALFVPSLAKRFTQVSQGLSLRFLDGAYGDIERLLKEDSIDAAIEREGPMPEWISSRLLFQSSFKVIARSGHPITAGIPEGAALPVDVFCRMLWALRSLDGSLSGIVDANLEKAGKARRVVLAVPHFHALVSTVQSTDLAAVVPVQVLAEQGHSLGLSVYDPPFDMPLPAIRLYWHERRDIDPANTWFRDQIADVCTVFESLTPNRVTPQAKGSAASSEGTAPDSTTG